MLSVLFERYEAFIFMQNPDPNQSKFPDLDLYVVYTYSQQTDKNHYNTNKYI